MILFALMLTREHRKVSLPFAFSERLRDDIGEAEMKIKNWVPLVWTAPGW